MCGIAGIHGPNGKSWINRVNALQAHRGPDGIGIYSDGENLLHLGHTRLSIIDLEKGTQPMSNEDGSAYIVFNGEIYNSPQLRQKLLSDGHIFKTDNSDTETLIHLYEEKGTSMLDDLNGMFAFTIYDKKKQILFCARDRIGIKPFYYSNQNGHFAFASELKGLIALPWVSSDINFQSLYHYLSMQFVPAPNTIIRNVSKLPKGHYLIYHLDTHKMVCQEYWDLKILPDNNMTKEQWQEKLRNLIIKAVQRWTLSDVPIACSLSGGLDSSAIVGILASGINKPLKTYSLGFTGESEANYNELQYARKVADKWGTEHHEIVLKSESLLEDIDDMVYFLDEPYGGGLPSWYVYREIAKDCKVVLTGTGGDELFGNYGKWRKYEQNFIKRYYLSALQFKTWCKCKMPLAVLKNPHGFFYHRYLTDAAKDYLCFDGKENKTFEKTESLLERLWQQSGSLSARDASAYIDFNLQLPEEFLHVTDRFSMAHSLEARVPLLDHELVELVYQIPSDVRTNVDDPKSLFREAIKDYLPEALLGRPKKGFTLPLPIWTRNKLKDRIQELLNPGFLKRQGIFSTRLWHHIVSPHLERQRDFTQQVWTLFMFQMWFSTLHNKQ